MPFAYRNPLCDRFGNYPKYPKIDICCKNMIRPIRTLPFYLFIYVTHVEYQLLYHLLGFCFAGMVIVTTIQSRTIPYLCLILKDSVLFNQDITNRSVLPLISTFVCKKHAESTAAPKLSCAKSTSAHYWGSMMLFGSWIQLLWYVWIQGVYLGAFLWVLWFSVVVESLGCYANVKRV